MKAFQFRLESALRWRVTQLRLAQEALSRAAGQVATVQARLNQHHADLRSGSAALVAAGSAAFETWPAYVERCRRGIRAAEEELREARKMLAERTLTMLDAHKKLQVIENLKRDAHARWTAESDRETEAFASEAFLARLVRLKTQV